VKGEQSGLLMRMVATESVLLCMWIADAHRDGKRFVVHADEKLTAFIELESAICSGAELS
jgi:hypothetical protein